MTVEYNEDIQAKILYHLDGWVIKDSEEEATQTRTVESSEENTGEVQPFITDITEYADNPNKKISADEVEMFFNSAFNKALLYCNRFNVEDLTESELEYFLQGVCVLTASDLWNKYNIRVNNEDMEDTYVQSYGGLLYKQATSILNTFINQRVTTITTLKKQKNDNSNIWII